MPKSIPVNLQTHYDGVVTTTCELVRIKPIDRAAFGLSGLDRDVTYDDGSGEVLYRAKTGAMLSAFESSLNLSVDNAEGQTLVSLSDSPITADDIRAGVLDGAEVDVYRVNYADLAMGHEILISGVLGRIKTDSLGMHYAWESRSISSLLKQTEVCERGSNICRATFGDARCGIDAEALWIEGEVTHLDVDEPDRIFVDNLTDFVTIPPGSALGLLPAPGLLEWLTGDNAGRSMEVESFGTHDTHGSGLVELFEPMPYDAKVGDTFRIRPDCAKRFLEDCVGLWDNHLGFRGEPYRNVSDAGQISVPGARVGALLEPSDDTE